MRGRPRSILLRALALAYGVLALLVPFRNAQAQPASAQEQARAALTDGRYAEAAALLTAALDRRPADASLLVLRGQAHEGRGQFGQAAADYERALALRPGSEAAREGLGRTRERLRLAREAALASHEQRVRADPENPAHRLRYAEALRDAGRADAAIEQYEAHLVRTQGTPDVVTAYLVLLAGQSRHRRGAAEAARYLALYPGSADLWMRLGYFRLWQGEHAGAEDAFRQALARDAGHREARRGLAQATAALATQAAPADPADDLRRTLEAEPDRPEVRFELVEALAAAGRHVEAFSELQALEPAFGRTARWRTLFEAVDAALPEDAEVYRVDRLAYRLALDPDSRAARSDLVDALADAGRYNEAYQTLLEGGRSFGPDDPAYQIRLRRLQEERLEQARAAQTALARRLRRDSTDREAARELAATYPVLQAAGDLGALDEPIALFEELLAEDPEDHELRLQYAQVLTQARKPAALDESRRLLAADPDDPRFAAQLAYAALLGDPIPADAERALADALRRHPEHPGLLLAAVTFHTDVDDLDRAEALLEGAALAGAPAPEVEARAEMIREARHYRILEAARAVASAGRYAEAVAGVVEYHQLSDRPMTREGRIELAQYHAAAGDADAALALLAEAQTERFTPEVQRTTARLLFDAGRYREALAAVRIALDADPADVQARVLLGDALRELGRYDEAEEEYLAAVAEAAPGTAGAIEDRLAFLDRITGFGTGLGVLLIPTTELVSAGGDGIDYRRLSPGLDAQVVLPVGWPVTFTGTYRAHRIGGTAFVQLSDDGALPDVPSFTAHQLGAGAILDLTPRDRTLGYAQNYTNRLVAEAGAFAYRGFAESDFGIDGDGSDAEPYAALRYLHQQPGRLRAEAALRRTSAAVALWAPAGPTADLALYEAEAHAEATPADSLFRLAGRAAYHRITSDAAGANDGYSVRAEAGVRAGFDGLYAGAAYARLQYADASPFYFSPEAPAYELLEAFVEYESRGRGQRPYVRALAALGVVPSAGGFLSRRVEADLIYPLVENLGLGLNLRLSESSRAFDDGAFSRYGIVALTGSLYVGL